MVRKGDLQLSEVFTKEVVLGTILKTSMAVTRPLRQLGKVFECRI